MRWELWAYGLAQLVVTVRLLADKPSDVETRVWTTRIVDYGFYVLLLTILYRQFKQSTGEVTTRRMVQFGSYASVVVGMKYVGSWFHMGKTSISLAAIGVACLYVVWYFVVISFVSLLWYGAMSAIQMTRERDEGVR